MSSKFKVNSELLAVSGLWSVIRKILIFMLITHCSLPTVWAHGGEDHADEKKPTITTGAKTAASVARDERNLPTDVGQFNAKLMRSPADPRTGELVQMAVQLGEKVEGGFGKGDPVPLEGANVTLTVTTADGKNVANNLPATFENGFYRADYTFNSAGNYKIVFNATTADKRSFSVDFPVTATAAPTNWYFWLGTLLLAAVSLGAVGWVFLSVGKSGNKVGRVRGIIPFAIAALLFFAFGTFALAYIAPPTERRAAVNFVPSGDAAQAETPGNALTTSLLVPKESQVLFGIKTAQVETRKITSGLKVTGVVRARPDGHAVVVPPVAGRIVLRQNLTIGSVVGRGEQIGSVEQILDVAGQVGLETQRLDVEAQQRDVEARKLELRNTALALQGQQAQQRAAVSQARTRLAQAERELSRSQNLVAVGAVPRKRVEEATTTVEVTQQEVAAAEQQVKLLDTQIKAAQTGQTIFRAPQVRQPTRSFPLTAPLTGIVNQINVTSGSQVEPATQVLTISNLASVLLEANVFERDLPTVRESSRASFTSPALPDETYQINGQDSRLLTVGQTVNEQTRTVPIVYEVKNPLQRLREGNFVEITIDTSGDRKVLAVPKASVVNEQGQTFVFVFTGGENFEKRPVALGAEGADFYEVKSGLKEGDRIVTTGVYQLRTTQPAT